MFYVVLNQNLCIHYNFVIALILIKYKIKQYFLKKYMIRIFRMEIKIITTNLTLVL